MKEKGRTLPNRVTPEAAAEILKEMEAGTGREELRRLLLRTTAQRPGKTAADEKRPMMEEARESASREDRKRDLEILSEGVEAAGKIIHDNIKGQPNRIRELEDTVRIPFSSNTANAAALVIIHAIRRTPGEKPAAMEDALCRWERSASKGSRDRFIPVSVMAARLLRNLSGREADQAFSIIRETASELQDPAVVGEMIQRLMPDRKRMAAFHTREESAIMMARLAIPIQRDWSGQQAARYRIADYSCGAGTLLKAAVERIREMTWKAGENPAQLHRQMMEQCITAIDILPASVAIAATEVDALEEAPEEHAEITGGITLRYGPMNGTQGARGRPSTGGGPSIGTARNVGLGALDIFRSPCLKRQTTSPLGREGSRDPGPVIRARSQNLVIMNPPFTKETEAPLPPVGSESSTTPEERDIALEKMRKVRAITHAGGRNGQAYHFAMLADRMVAADGAIALVLPETALTGSGNSELGWPEFRRTIARDYRNILVLGITAFEEGDSMFSHDALRPEVILIARKKRKGEYHRRTADFVNLSRRPEGRENAVRIGEIIQDILWDTENREAGTCCEVHADELEIRSIKARLPRDGSPWRETRVRNQELNQKLLDLRMQRVGKGSRRIPTTTLGEIARIALDEDSMSGREARENQARRMGREDTSVPALVSHECDMQRTIEAGPNGSAVQQPGKRLRRSRLHINNSFRYNAQSNAACMTTEPTVGSSAWPTLGVKGETAQKALAIWMNTTPGLMAHWQNAVRHQHGMGYLNSRGMKDMVVLDPGGLDDDQLAAIEELFQETRNVQMLPANEAWRDEARIELDRRMMEILGMAGSPEWDLDRMREQWCWEPTVAGRKGKQQHYLNGKFDRKET